METSTMMQDDQVRLVRRKEFAAAASSWGTKYVKSTLFVASFLYSASALIHYWAPEIITWSIGGYMVTSFFGWVLSTIAFIQLYRVGYSCTTLNDLDTAKPFTLSSTRRIVGQISLLLLMRPIVSLRTHRADEASEKTLLGSRRLFWLCYKISESYDIGKQKLYIKAHNELSQNGYKWLTLQFAAIIAFAAIFFPLMLNYTGVSGLTRYWVVPFVAMHIQLGSMKLKSKKEESFSQADKIFNVSFCRPKRVKTHKVVVAPAPAAPAHGHAAPQFKESATPSPPRPLHWFNIIYMSLVHVLAVVGLVLAFTSASWTTLFVTWAWMMMSQFGITAGVHRLWAHRSYTAHPALEAMLMVMNSMANEGSILKWSRDHRVHHKHVDTPLDPHDATQGFWYSHIGWLLVKKDERVIKAGKNVHMDDLLTNKIVMFQHRNYAWWGPSWCFLVPTVLCGVLAGDAWNAFFVGVFRYSIVLHFTWFVNSLAHLYGTRPYLSTILPCENWIVSLCAAGEGWHNYHHAYPYDYSASEYGYKQYNPTTVFLDICALFGLVKDRRRANVKGHADTPDSELPKFSMEDVKAMTNQAAMLIIIDGYVYDVASFVTEGLHPGGERIVKAYLGKDVSKVFSSGAKHSHTPAAYNLLKQYKTGMLKV